MATLDPHQPPAREFLLRQLAAPPPMAALNAVPSPDRALLLELPGSEHSAPATTLRALRQEM